MSEKKPASRKGSSAGKKKKKSSKEEADTEGKAEETPVAEVDVDISEDEEETGEDMAGKKATLEGFLTKKGEKGLAKLWRKRYFRLYPEERCMSYFKNEKQTKETGRIVLNGALLVELDNQKKFGFKITMKTTARVWLLAAKTDEDRQKWLDAIEEQLQKAQEAAKAGASAPAGDAPVSPVAAVQGPLVDQTPVFAEDRQLPYQWAGDKEVRRTTAYDPPESFEVQQHEKKAGDVQLRLVGNNVAFVHEVLQLALDAEKRATVKSLPRQFQPSSLVFRGLSDPNASIAESRHFQEKHNVEELLRKLDGKQATVQAVRDARIAATIEEAKKFSGTVHYLQDAGSFLLADDAGVHFLRTDDHVSFQFDHDGDRRDLFRTNQLELKVDTDGSDVLAELMYAAPKSIEWNAEYTGVLSPKENELHLNGYAVIRNRSGRDFENAAITLEVAAEPKEGGGGLLGGLGGKKSDDEEDEEAPAAPTSKMGGLLGKLKNIGGGLAAGALSKMGKSGGGEAALFPHVYELDGTHTLGNGLNEELRVRLVSATLPVRSYHLVRFNTPAYEVKARVDEGHGAKATASVRHVIEFKNEGDGAGGALGRRLPAGKLQLNRYLKSGFGVERLSVASLPHMEVNDRVTASIETIDGITVSRERTGFNYDDDKRIAVETFEVKVGNGTTFDTEVVVEEAMYRWSHWEVTYASHPFSVDPEHSRRVLWKFPLEAYGGRKTLKYTIFYEKIELAGDGVEHSDSENEEEEEEEEKGGGDK